MRGITVSKAADIVGGKLINDVSADKEILGAVIDSRQVTDGALFAAIKGERSDGHDYVNKAFELGAVCCLTERVVENAVGSIIVVDDVQLAFKQLAEAYRETLNIPIIGIAGSVGKTTAKEMVSSVLSEKYKVLKTEKNFNNELGVPLTLFRINPEHEVAVVEMGISDFGEMRRLAKMVKPTMAVYTLIGHAHLERLINLEGVLKAKTEMIEYMPSDAVLFLNGDDELLASFDCPLSITYFGTEKNSSVRAENISFSQNGSECDIVCGERRIKAVIPSYGKHMIYAALEGAAVGIKIGLSDEEIASGILSYETVGRRAAVINTGYITLIDDCYNANPDSVKCSIDSLAQRKGRRVCILGDMLEMGTDVEALHAGVGKYAAERGIELLLCVGERSKHTCEGAEDMEAYHFETNEDLIERLGEYIQQGDIVLVKASNSMRFDTISEALKILK